MKSSFKVLLPLAGSQYGPGLPTARLFAEQPWTTDPGSGEHLSDSDLLLLDLEGIQQVAREVGEQNTAVQLAPLLSNARAVGLYSDGEVRWDDVEGIGLLPREKCIGIRHVPGIENYDALEVVRLGETDLSAVTYATRWAKQVGMPCTVLEFDAPGGARERIRVPLETELWRLVREGIATPAQLERITRATLGLEVGLTGQIRMLDPTVRSRVIRELAIASFGDSRFRPPTETFPPDLPGGLWSTLDKPSPELEAESAQTFPKNILIVGTPQLVEAWSKLFYEKSNGKVQPVAWPIWDTGGVTEEALDEIAGHGPFELVVECLVGSIDDRQALLESLLDSLNSDSIVWAHNLSAAASLTVQVLPEEIDAVGYGGLPPLWEDPVIEFSRPASSDRSSMTRAAKIARTFGLIPFETGDEPGGVGARLLAVLINATAYLVREGIVAAPTEADLAAKDILQLPLSPFHLADAIGLDIVEGVLLGLATFTGEDRYRICPDLLMRIETGAVGAVTGKGFYIP